MNEGRIHSIDSALDVIGFFLLFSEREEAFFGGVEAELAEEAIRVI